MSGCRRRCAEAGCAAGIVLKDKLKNSVQDTSSRPPSDVARPGSTRYLRLQHAAEVQTQVFNGRNRRRITS
jgi:hypothetical protein